MIYIGKKKCYTKSQIKRDKIDYSYAIIDTRDIDMVQAFSIKKEELLEYMKTKKENQTAEK